MKTSKLKPITLILLVAVLVAGSDTLATDIATAEAGWAVKGTWSDTCSCKVSCTCFMGSGPTEHFCEGSSLVEIDEGHYDGVELDGLKAMFSHRIGQWARIYVADTATPEQVDALTAVIPLTIPFIEEKIIETVEVVPISVERTETTIRFSAPETTVELEIVLGANGTPVSISNLPLKGLPFPEVLDHRQYKSILSKHESEAHHFEWSDRNGFVARVDRSGELPAQQHRE